MISNYRGRPMAVKAGRAASAFAFYVAFWILLMAGNAEAAGTSVGFYSSSCPKAEAIVQQVVMARFAKDKTVTAALLRMFFHDCFVNGCDASILIDSTPNNQAEKEAGPNLTVRDFDLIDEVKQALEAACPGIVSCADIIAIAVRDALVLSGGPSYAVPCGRRDGLISRIADADNLPSPSFTVDQVRVSFEDKGLTLTDMVVLLGAHTVGSALCGFFSDRVFSFHGTAAPDPSMNVTLARRLASVCPNPFTSESNADPAVALDQGTPLIFDSSYFAELKGGNGILQIDQELTGDARTLPLVSQFSAHQDQFFAAFAKSILLMGNIDVKTTPAQGEIRSQCRKINSKNAAPPSASTPPKPASPPPKTPSPPPKPASLPPKLTSLPSKPASPAPKPASRPPPRRRRNHRSAGGRTSVHRRRASLASKLISGPKSHHHARQRRGKNRRHRH